LAVANLEHLGDYGVNEARLQTIDELSQAFSELIGRPRAVIDARKRATSSLPTLMADADKYLAKLDRLADVLNEDYPEFAEGFRTSRKIINVSASRALSEAEKASADARDARKALAKARKDATLAEIRKETEATHAQARSIAPSASETPAKRESGPTPSPAPADEGVDSGLNS
jgi:ABC-type transporter Mla subunit MlaD